MTMNTTANAATHECDCGHQRQHDDDQQPTTTKNTNTNQNASRNWIILGLKKKHS